MKILIKRRFIFILIIFIVVLLISSYTLISNTNNHDLSKSLSNNNLKSFLKSLNTDNPELNEKIKNIDPSDNDIISCLSECLLGENKNNNNIENKNETNDDADDVDDINEYKEEVEDVENVEKDDKGNDELNAIIEETLLNLYSKPVKPDDFILLKQKEEAHTALWNLIFKKYTAGDTKITKDILINHSSFLTQKDISDLPKNEKMLATLHQSLYSWVYHSHYKSLADIIKSSNGKGIVICAGNYHFNFARSSIDILRNVIKTNLPIEIFYNGDNDLSSDKRNILSEFKDVFLTDISSYFDNEVINLGGWAIKPFSILASRFEEVILMDADAVYIRDPSILFKDEGYIEKGTVFFRDRTLFPGSHPGSKWLKSWMTDPLPETKELRYWNEITSHEMESSTVVIDKTRNILGLLNVCKLNEQKIRDDVVYKYVHGDKETFWIGFDMARQSFNMLPTPSVFIGELAIGEAGDNPNARQLCGHVGHATRDRKILFWNDHIIKDKNDDKYKHKLLRFEAYFIEDGEAEWPSFHCLNLNIENKGKGNREGKEPTKFNEEERKVLDDIIERENKYHYALPELKNKEEEKKRNKSEMK